MIHNLWLGQLKERGKCGCLPGSDKLSAEAKKVMVKVLKDM